MRGSFDALAGLQVYLHGPFVVFQYESEKGGETMKAKLKGRQGFLPVDAEHRFNSVFGDGKLLEAGDEAHGRRRYEAAVWAARGRWRGRVVGWNTEVVREGQDLNIFQVARALIRLRHLPPRMRGKAPFWGSFVVGHA